MHILKKIQKICWYHVHILVDLYKGLQEFGRGTNIFKVKRNDFITDSLTKSHN